jgi:hypothetical protein
MDSWIAGIQNCDGALLRHGRYTTKWQRARQFPETGFAVPAAGLTSQSRGLQHSGGDQQKPRSQYAFYHALGLSNGFA